MIREEEILKHKILTIPNILSFFRLCLIPVFAWLYCVEKNHIWTGIVLIGICVVMMLLSSVLYGSRHIRTLKKK